MFPPYHVAMLCAQQPAVSSAATGVLNFNTGVSGHHRFSSFKLPLFQQGIYRLADYAIGR